MSGHSTKICSFEGCGRLVNGKGLCRTHLRHKRANKKLVPAFSTKRANGTPPRIICDEVTQPNPELEGPCYVFRRAREGWYGLVRIAGKHVLVHRYCWEREVGPIPAGMVMDHKCRNRACCNVDHLRVVTRKINSTENVVGAAWQLFKARTHCKKGHPLIPKTSGVGRYCPICKKDYDRNRRK